MQDYQDTSAQQDSAQYIKNKGKGRVAFLTLLGLGLLVGATLATLYLIKNRPVHSGTPTPTPPLVVSSILAEKSDNQVSIHANAVVTAKDDTVLSSQLSGTITYVSPGLEPGYLVDKGDVLVKIDDSDYLANLASAKAAIATAERVLAEEKAQAIQAKRDQARAGIDKISDLARRVPQIAEATASLESSKAQYEKAKIDLERSQIKAPFRGLVISRDVDVGELVSNGTALLQVVNIERFKVEIALSDDEINLISQTPNAKITLTDNSGAEWQTLIDSFAPNIDAQNRTLSVTAYIDAPYQNPQKPLRLESFVDAKIEGNLIKNSLWLDNESIVNNAFVWMVDEQYQLKKVPVNVIYNQAKKSLVTYDVAYNNLIKVPLPSFRDNKSVVIKTQDGKFQMLQDNKEVSLSEQEFNQLNTDGSDASQAQPQPK